MACRINKHCWKDCQTDQ